MDANVAVAVAGIGGCRVSQLGLRFDRVVVRLLNELAPRVDAHAPGGVSVVLTLTAPIRRPRQMVGPLQQEIATLLNARSGSRRDFTLLESRGQLRLIEHGNKSAPRLLGFVHNLSVDATQIGSLAEEWLRAGA